jgi:hypothetical protein
MLTATVASTPALACHTYASPVDGRIGCFAFNRDRSAAAPEPVDETPPPEDEANRDVDYSDPSQNPEALEPTDVCSI